MQSSFIFLAMFFAFASAVQADEPKAAPQPSTPSVNVTKTADSTLADYRLGAGDLLEISVWKEEGLTKQVLVRPDGGITFPLIGGLQAGGRTVKELQDEVNSRLTNYLSDPEATVALLNVGQKVYVVGKVIRPNEYIATRPIDVMQALALAGGLSPFADRDEIRVLRRVGNKTVSFEFDYDDVAAGENLEQNVMLQGGDVVVVP